MNYQGFLDLKKIKYVKNVDMARESVLLNVLTKKQKEQYGQ